MGKRATLELCRISGAGPKGGEKAGLFKLESVLSGDDSSGILQPRYMAMSPCGLGEGPTEDSPPATL